MPILTVARRLGSCILAAATLAGLSSRGWAQPAAPAAPATVDNSPQALADRLRKLEEANQRLLQQYQDVARQNETLSRKVQDLSKRLEKPSRDPAPPGDGPRSSGGSAGTSPSASAGGNETAELFGGALDEPPLTGGLTSPPGPGDRPPSRERQLSRLRGYYDESYRQRYGYVLESRNGEFELRFNGLLQVDARMYGRQNQTPVINDFDIPRARVYFSGRMTKPIEYQLSFQRSTNSLDILNAYLNFRYDERLQLRIGRFRSPYTYEWAKLSVWELLTPDRSPFALNFGPNRQIGLMGWGNLFKSRLEYAVALMDGPRNSFQDFNNAKDLMAFVDYRPFLLDESPLQNLSLGGSVDQGKQNNPLSPALLRGSTSASSNTLATGSGDSVIAVPFLAFNNGVRERGDRALWELHATYFYKGLSLLGAWDSGHNDFALGNQKAPPVHLPVSGFFVQAGYLITGETLDKRMLVEPRRPFDLRKGKFGPGALELQARYSTLDIGRQVFTSGLADPNLWTNRFSMVDAGFNWYLTKNVKFYFDWEHAMFAQPVYFRPGPGFQKTNDLFWMRLQLYY